MNNPIISLCLPTNGVIEWVFPVLDSIYNENVNQSMFEVIVTNNGDNDQFHKMMLSYEKKHDNLIYKKNNVYQFYNQLEALKLASGKYFKLINHRAVFLPGALEKMINIIKENEKEKPVFYFSNGALDREQYKLENFDQFVCTLKRYVSWTTGVGIWREDYEKLAPNIHVDKISPHSCVLFSERKKNKYIIDNMIFSKEIDFDQSKKGKYDLFKAFAVEEFTIALNLYIDGDISIKTLRIIKKDYENFVCELFYDYIIRKRPCSYDLTGFNDSMGIFFERKNIIEGVCKLIIKKFMRKLL